MAEQNMFRTFEILIVGIAGALLLIGLWPPGNFAFQLIGIIMSFVGLALTFLITIGTEGESDVGDIALVNALIYPLIVGDILAIGSWFDADPIIQSLFLDLGLIMGIALVFTVVWYFIKQKVGFLQAEEVEPFSSTDKDSLPKYFLVTLVFGALYGGIFFGFKVLYNILNYNLTVYAFMGLIAILALLLVFIKR